MSDHWHGICPLSALLPACDRSATLVLLAVPPLALALDCWLSGPPAAWHPVVWMGQALQRRGERLAPTAPVLRDWKCFWLAALAWTALATVVLLLSWTAQQLLLMLHGSLAAALLALLLRPLLAWRKLRDEVLAVEAALGRSLPAGRAQLSRLMSRDVSALSAEEVRESAIASRAGNLNDSVVAPLFWFALLGLPGAALYRFANTADACWGYPGMHGGRYWQWAGKWAARADDVLSWLPARITALLLAGRSNLPLRRLARQARKTPSPNSGWPMAAMALVLDVCLHKPGVYTLHGAGRSASPLDTQRAARIGNQLVLALLPVVAVLQLLMVLAVLVSTRMAA